MAKLNFLIDAQYRAADAFSRARGDIDSLDDKAGRMSAPGGGLFSLGNMLKTGLVAAAGAATAALGGLAIAVGASIGEAAELESQMSAIAAVMGKTKNEVEPLQELILKLGLDPNLKVNATEAANAIELLARNGLSMTEILDGAAKATVMLSNSTGADFGTAADIATDAMSLFNIGAAEMMSVVNGITGVTNNSKFSIDDYALALGNGAKGAVAANMSFDQFNTILAATASNFTSGMTAGTGLTAMLLGLSPRTKKAEETMRELGIITDDGTNRFFDLNGEIRSNAEISEVMRSTLGKLTTQQRINAVDTLFGRDAMAAINGMISTTTDSWREHDTALKNTDAAQAAATRTDNLRGSLEILSGVVETLRLKLGNALIPVVRRMVDVFAEFLERYSGRIEVAFVTLAIKIDELIANTISLAATTQSLWDRLSNLLQPVTDAIARFVSWKDVLVVLSATIAAVIIPAIASIVTAIAPIAAVLVGSIAAVAALRNAWQADFLGIRSTTLAGVEYIKEQFSPLASTLREHTGAALNEIVHFVRTGEGEFAHFLAIMADVKTTVKSIWTDILSTTRQKAAEWGPAVGQFSQTALQKLPEIVSTMHQYGAALVNWIGTAVPQAIDAFRQYVLNLISWIRSPEGNGQIAAAISGWRDSLLEWIRGAGAQTGPAFQEFLGAILRAVGNISLALVQAFGEIGLSLIAALLDAIVPGSGQIVDSLRSMFTTALEAMRGFINNPDWSIGSTLIGKITSGITNGVNDARHAINVVMDGMIQQWNTRIDPLLNHLKSQGGNLLSRMGQGIQGANNEVLGRIDESLNFIQSKWNTRIDPLLNHLKVQGGRFLAMLRDGLAQAYNDPLGSIDIAMDFVISKWNTRIDPILQHLKAQGGNMLGKIKEGIATMWNDALGIIDRWADALWGKLDLRLGWQQFFSIGERMMQGLIAGINHLKQSALDTVSNVGDSIVGGLKGLLGISSPSRVFAEMGADLMRGLAQGVEEMAALPALAVEGAALGVAQPVTALGNQVSNLSNITNSTNNAFNINFSGGSTQDNPDEIRRLLSTLNAAVEVP